VSHQPAAVAVAVVLLLLQLAGYVVWPRKQLATQTFAANKLATLLRKVVAVIVNVTVVVVVVVIVQHKYLCVGDSCHCLVYGKAPKIVY